MRGSVVCYDSWIGIAQELVRAKKLKASIERKPFAELPAILSTAHAGFKNRKTVLVF